MRPSDPEEFPELVMAPTTAEVDGVDSGREGHHEADSEVARARIELATHDFQSRIDRQRFGRFCRDFPE